MPDVIILETDRLILRQLTLGDLDYLETLLGDTGVMRWWPVRFDHDGADPAWECLW